MSPIEVHRKVLSENSLVADTESKSVEDAAISTLVFYDKKGKLSVSLCTSSKESAMDGFENIVRNRLAELLKNLPQRLEA